MASRPQLFKDVPILDPITPVVEYVTGNTPSNDAVKGGAPLLVGGTPKITDASKILVKQMKQLKKTKN